MVSRQRPISTQAALLQQAVCLHGSGLSFARVGALLGLCPNTVRSYLRRVGMEIRGRRE